MRRRGARATLVLVCGVLASRAIAEEPKRASFTLARAAAEENAETPAGRRYEVAFLSSLDPWLPPAIERCAKDVPREDRIAFEVLVRVSRSGEPEEVLFEPQTTIARCVAPEFRTAKYPFPPRPSWWSRVEIQLR